MKSVNTIKSINYSKIYNAIHSITISIGHLDYVFKTEYGVGLKRPNKISIATYFGKCKIDTNEISYSQLYDATINSYPCIEGRIPEETNKFTHSWTFDVNALVRLLFPNIDQVLHDATAKQFDLMTIYEDLALDPSILNSLVNSGLITHYLPSIDMVIHDINQQIKTKKRKAEVLNKEIEHLEEFSNALLEAKERTIKKNIELFDLDVR